MSGHETAIRLGTSHGVFDLDPSSTAVVVVDMQNDFGAPHGMFERAGIDISGIRAAVDPTARVLGAARSIGLRIVYLKMGFKSDLSDAGLPDSPNWCTGITTAFCCRTAPPNRSARAITSRL